MQQSNSGSSCFTFGPRSKKLSVLAFLVLGWLAMPWLSLPYGEMEWVVYSQPDGNSTPAGQAPAGSDKVTARVFVDRNCVGGFQRGIDVPLSNARVQLTFSDGTTVIGQTSSSGTVYFAGIDASQGVTVSLLDLADMRYRGQYLCACNPTTAHFPASDFDSANVGHKHVDFRVTPSLSPWPF